MTSQKLQYLADAADKRSQQQLAAANRFDSEISYIMKPINDVNGQRWVEMLLMNIWSLFLMLQWNFYFPVMSPWKPFSNLFEYDRRSYIFIELPTIECVSGIFWPLGTEVNLHIKNWQTFWKLCCVFIRILCVCTFLY